MLMAKAAAIKATFLLLLLVLWPMFIFCTRFALFPWSALYGANGDVAANFHNGHDEDQRHKANQGPGHGD
jgi:hypothetical protein